MNTEQIITVIMDNFNGAMSKDAHNFIQWVEENNPAVIWGKYRATDIIKGFAAYTSLCALDMA